MDDNVFEPLEKNYDVEIGENVEHEEQNQSFFSKNKIYILIALVLVIIVGVYLYFYSYKNPKELTDHEELKNNINQNELENLKNTLDLGEDECPNTEVEEYLVKYKFIDTIPDTQILASNPAMAQMYINAKKVYKKISTSRMLPDKYDNILLLYIKQLYDAAKKTYDPIIKESSTKPKKPKPKVKVKPPPSPPPVEEVEEEIKTIDMDELKDLNED